MIITLKKANISGVSKFRMTDEALIRAIKEMKNYKGHKALAVILMRAKEDKKRQEQNQTPLGKIQSNYQRDTIFEKIKIV